MPKEELPAENCSTQQLALSEDVLLADELLESARSHPRCQGSVFSPGKKRIGRTHSLRSSIPASHEIRFLVGLTQVDMRISLFTRLSPLATGHLLASLKAP